ncbi:MAG TPA: sialate O-acetylesterase [Acetobacteraceae bacterium]|nr:sialate O-acetylesterase [Acetobacteraceae bacterium]
MIFVQREGTTGTVRFTGDAARVLDAGGNVVRDWTSGGTLSGIPQGDGYRLEVRTGNTVKADALAIGAVVFVLGQSNIQRWFDTPPGGVSTPGIYNMEYDGKIGTQVTGSAAQHFTQGYAAALGVPVMIVEGARGGTALLPEADKGNGNWLSTASGSLYANALARLQQVGGKAELVLWGQGETDASANVTTSAYAVGLTTFMNRVLSDFAPDRVLIQEIGPHGTEPDKYDQVRAAQHQVAAAIGPVDIGALTFDTNTIEDGVHLSGASRVLAADRMLVSALAVEGIDIARTLWQGGSENDARTGGAGRDELRGGAGNDTLNGGEGSDVLLGGSGSDSLSGGGGMDIIRGDDGDDVVDGGAGNDVISGGRGADSLAGGEGNDEIWADADNDTILGGAGNDLIYGGAGTDVAAFSGPRAGYAILVSGSTIRVTDIDLSNGNDGQDTLIGIEFLRFSDGTIDPRGASLPPLFSENTDYVDFNNIVAGEFSAPSYYAALGGNDEVYLPVDLAAAQRAGYDPKMAFDAGSGNDIVVGGSLADTIRGGSGSDILNGGAGNDRMEGGAGDDIFEVDNSKDIVSERPNEGYDTVRAMASFTLKDNVEALVLLGTGNFSGMGNNLANAITGNAGNNRLSGMEGNDTLIGGSGNDTLDGGTGMDSLVGGLGNDRYIVDSDGDIVVELAGGGTTDEVQAFVSYALPAEVERLLLMGSANINGTGNGLDNRITGNSGNNVLQGGGGRDTLLGGAGNDVLFGGEGNDTLEGGTGSDTLTGGLGNDRFVYRSLTEVSDPGGANPDMIMDFARGDRVDLSRIDAITGGSDDAFVFRGTQPATGAGQLTVVQDGSAMMTYVFGHVDGDLIADFRLNFAGLISLTASDFSL